MWSLGLEVKRILLSNLRLSTEYQKFKVDSAHWHSWSEEIWRAHVRKLQDYVSTFSNEFVKSTNGGRKPGFSNWKIYREPPTVFVDRVEEQQEEGSQDLRLKFVKSPESQIRKASGSSNEDEIRFSDPNEKRPKVFEVHLQKDVPKLVKKCQEKGRWKIEEDSFAVRVFGPMVMEIKNSKFGPLYIHFERKCLERFNGDICYRPTLSFGFSRIKVDSKCKTQLTENEKQFLINRGVTSWWSSFNLRVFFRYFFFLYQIFKFQNFSVMLKRA